MDRVADQPTTLAGTVRQEIERYVASSDVYQFYPICDDEHQTYAVVIVPEETDERPSWVFVMARIIHDRIIIDEDGSLDKPLVEALMVNGGIPREKIVLAYKGETIPEDK